MVGIVSYGVYIPWFRLSRDTIASVWGTRSIGGERSVANYDEDSLTMAVEASFHCLEGINREKVDGLFFASTTSPYREKQVASLICPVIDLRSEIITADFGGSLRAGTTALKLAAEMVKSGSVQNILVVAADCRLGYPQSVEEQSFGDGAVALLVGNTESIVEIEDSLSVSDAIMDVWRKDRDTFVSAWEDRWVLTYGYMKNMRRAISKYMEKKGTKADDFAKAVFSAPDLRSQQNLAEELGFRREQLQDPLLAVLGNTGSAHPFMMLAATLDEAKVGDRTLFASYGDGSDVFSLKVTKAIKADRKQRSVKSYLNARKLLPSYERYLIYRELIPQPEEFVRLFPSATIMWRTQNWVLSCHGSKCRACELVTFPVQRVCYGCQSKDDYDEVRLSDRKGKVFTFSLDYFAGTPNPPVVQTIVESETGARIYCLMTDCEPKEVSVNMPVEMTFRRFHEVGGFVNYFWKCRPLRGE